MDKWLHCAGTVLAQVGSPLSHHSLPIEQPGWSHLGQLNFLEMAVELVVWLGKENKKCLQKLWLYCRVLLCPSHGVAYWY